MLRRCGHIGLRMGLAWLLDPPGRNIRGINGGTDGLAARHAWWGLVVMSVIVGLFGVTDVIGELEADSAQAYRLLDFMVRAGGVHLIVMGGLMTAMLLLAFRRGQRWAWWAIWTLPAWAASAFALNFVYGMAPGQAPPPPMISGPIFAVLAAAILLVSAPRFVRADR
jgi:hypothetical protein